MRERLAEIQTRCVRACEQAGRDPSAVRLVAVSKGQSAEKILEAYALGVRDFGENYAIEMARKSDELKSKAPDIRWHYMGRIQSNKMREIANASWIHSLGELRHANMLSEMESESSVLLQVNLGGEQNRSGVAESEVVERYRQIRELPDLKLCGLMTIAPLHEGVEPAHWFRKMADLKKHVEDELGAIVPELSMGMSADFEQAIVCGATMIRVGTLLFGERV